MVRLHNAFMIHDVGNRILNQAERKLGKLAISGVIRWIAIFQIAVWALSLISPGLLKQLDFYHAEIFQGQVWRIFSWVFMSYPGNPLFALFRLFILWFISDALEGCWGVFRTNVYVVAMIAGISAICLLPQLNGAGLYMTEFFFLALFMTFAAALPNQIISLFGVIPIKAKWLGIADAAFIISMVMREPALLPMAIVGLIPFVLVFAPIFFSGAKNRGETAVRRAKFQQKMAPGDSFHYCYICGKTENEDPHLEFRVAADGEEYCVDHLPKKAD